MAEADVVERLLPGQVLVPRVEVDRRVVLAVRVVVEIAVVDVEIDAAELVHDVAEADEVDRDDVVDRDAGQLLDGLQRPARPAVRVGLVDPAGERQLARAAGNRDDEVARERHHRDDLLLRVGAQQHDRVRARADRALRPEALVVADHQRDSRLVRRRHVEILLGVDEGLRVCAHLGDALVDVEPGAAGERSRRDEHDHHEPEEELAEETQRPPALGAVPGDAGERRNRDPTVAVSGMAGCSTLEGRSHMKSRRRGDYRRIAERTAAEVGSRWGLTVGAHWAV